ncbi:hypothetical protein P3F83_22720 [Mycobacteroides immunogenum]|uniref:hypothetical protein n=1 Tax=Mycobacteroides immunogenum TaxID=83262 RepID=UPI0025B73EF4|nr:hypothetical protein [Mycobacteroides immunogenum]WJR33240.1 hypothetical protein P3F83_22720 [Mycobacteroides immunogenum]
MTAPQVTVRRLPKREVLSASKLLAAAFIDDPLCLAVSPKAESSRRFTLRCFNLAELVIAFGRRAYVYGAYTDGRLSGVVIAYPNGTDFPWWSWLVRLPAAVPSLLLAGPRTMMRGAKILNDIEDMRPTEPYVHFWTVGAASDTRGIGVMLLRKVLTEHVDPEHRNAFLEAAGPHLLELYGLLGFEEQQEYVLPTGEALITMWRPGVKDCL